MRRIVLLSMLLCPIAASAQPQRGLEGRLRKELSDVQNITNQLVTEAQRDTEILRMLLEANRALDNWQKNTALDDAMERIAKADKIAVGPPAASPKVRRAVQVAKEIVEPAAESPTTADPQKLREQLNSRSILWVREEVTEEMHGLAVSATMLSDAAALLTKALASSSSAVVGRSE